jgi:hypothetical protein
VCCLQTLGILTLVEPGVVFIVMVSTSPAVSLQAFASAALLPSSPPYQNPRSSILCCADGGQLPAPVVNSRAPAVAARGANAARLARFLAADWHNPKQSMENPQFWAHIHSCFRPLPNSFLNGYAMYTESAYDYNLGLPYKTSVVLIVQPPDAANNPNALELRSFKLKNAEEFWLGSHERELLEALTPDMLVELPCECNTVYVWLEDQGMYVAFSRPGKGCIIRRGGTERPTYLDSRITLSRQSYSPWDVGLDIETDERVWGGAAGAFDFVAKSRFEDEVSDFFSS